MKKYLIAILIILILMMGGITAIAAKLYIADYSPNINVTAENNPSEGAMSAYSQVSVPKIPTTSETDSNVDTQSVENKQGRIVYITPYGLKYHYRKTCAGKNATEIEWINAEKTFAPCAKCVH